MKWKTILGPPDDRYRYAYDQIMKIPASIHSVTLSDRAYDVPYPPLGFCAIAEHQLGNGDTFGLYWPIGYEDRDPIVAETYHDEWSLQPHFSSLDCFLAASAFEHTLNDDGDERDLDDFDDDSFVGTPTIESDPRSPAACLVAARDNLKSQKISVRMSMQEAKYAGSNKQEAAANGRGCRVMNHIQEGTSELYSQLLGTESIGVREGNLPAKITEFVSKYGSAREFLEKLVPDSAVQCGWFNVFSIRQIESSLIDFEWSKDFMELGLLPFSDFEDDKICCFDCINLTYQALEWVGHPHVEPFRTSLVFRTRAFMHFIEFMKWRNLK